MPLNLNLIVDKNPISSLVKKIADFCPVSIALRTLNQSLFEKMPEISRNFFIYLGAATLTFWSMKFLWRVLRFVHWMPGHIYRNLNIANKNLNEKYGNGYVVITGCTDGIGLSYAEIFANMGCNLVLIARNQAKLEQVVRNITNKHPILDIITLIADLGSLEQIRNLSKELQVLSNRIDISIVVNCAGVGHTGSWLLQDPSKFKSTLNVNFMAPYEICKVMVPRLQNRLSRSALINVSSCTGYFNSLSVGIYPSLKRMLDIYTRTLSLQNNNIDIISSKPFGVKTRMVGYHDGPLIISPEVCVLSTLADLGHTDHTYTGFKHKVFASVLSCYSEEEAQKFYRKSFDKINKRLGQRKSRKK